MVYKTDSCWLWNGSRNQYGYGFFIDKYQKWSAHRWSYAHWVGAIPKGGHICHKCHNPPCVNPAHLYAGDASTNGFDKKLKRIGITADMSPAEIVLCFLDSNLPEEILEQRRRLNKAIDRENRKKEQRAKEALVQRLKDERGIFEQRLGVRKHGEDQHRGHALEGQPIPRASDPSEGPSQGQGDDPGALDCGAKVLAPV